MLNSINGSTDRFLDTLARLNTRMETLQRQIGTGKKFTEPSDAPDEISAVLTLRAGIGRLDQINTNMGQVKTEADTAEASLNSAVSLYDRARTLATSGANGTQTAASRRTIADEIGSLMDRMVALSNTEVSGRYLFSGDADQTIPYALDWQQTPPVSTYAGASSTRAVLHPTGITFGIAKTAQEVFDNADPNRNVFQTLESVRQALLANDDTALATAIQPMAQVSSHLNSMLGFYGNVQSQVADATDSVAKMKLRLETELSQAEDADIVSATVELTQLKLQQEASLQVRASLPRTSLFDYLK